MTKSALFVVWDKKTFLLNMGLYLSQSWRIKLNFAFICVKTPFKIDFRKNLQILTDFLSSFRSLLPLSQTPLQILLQTLLQSLHQTLLQTHLQNQILHLEWYRVQKVLVASLSHKVSKMVVNKLVEYFFINILPCYIHWQSLVKTNDIQDMTATFFQSKTTSHTKFPQNRHQLLENNYIITVFHRYALF